MKLASFRAGGRDSVGILVDGSLVDVTELGDFPGEMIPLISGGKANLKALEEALNSTDRNGLTLHGVDTVQWRAPVPAPSKVVCIALNNASLDAIKVKAPTDHPAFFLKPGTAVTGHLQPIEMKDAYGFTHPEPELGVIIGERVKDATPEQALACVFGYTIVNDVTSVGMREEDSFSLRYFSPDPASDSGEMVEALAHTTYPGRYKASDTFAPMGPFLTTADEVPDPAALTIACRMGDRLVASDHTSNYVWTVANALSHISRTMTLLPGDVVSMGTAVGGDQQDPDKPHIPGVTRCNLNHFTGTVEIEIGGLGRLVNPIRQVG